MTGSASACHNLVLMLLPTVGCPNSVNEGNYMRRFKKFTTVLWHCQYHMEWVPKYRYRVLQGVIGQEAHNSIEVFCSQLRCQVVELNVQPDHVHLLVKVPPKVSISKLMGVVKGRTALRLFSRFPQLRQRPYWGNHFWAKGYCVDTVGVDAEIIRKYVKYQEKLERNLELDFD